MADLLNIGISGLNASKKGLHTTGHNLANSNTEGYSRQRISQTSNVPVTRQGMIEGTGVRVNGINRFHDPFIEKRLNDYISQHDFYNERSQQLEQVENIFNEINVSGLTKMLNGFYNSFRDLANQPENEAVRSVVRDKAMLVVKDFHRIRETLDKISVNIDKKMVNDITDINTITKNIAKLNKKIVVLESTGNESGDLRDQRDNSVRDLSKYFKITSYLDDKEHYCVNARGVGTLVAAGVAQSLKVGALSKSESTNNMAGSIEIFFENKEGIPITNKFESGSMSSRVEIRNVDIQNIQKSMDEIAFNFAHAVNAVHRRGYINKNIVDSTDGTGVNFFSIGDKKANSAHEIDLSEEVRSNLFNVVTALNKNSPGDNRVALAISKLQHEKIFKEGTTTLEEQFLQTIANVGLEAGKAKMDSSQSEGILAQTNAIKERLSGVSIDEETANMMRYQQAYEASARVLRTANEMFNTVLGIMR